MRKFLTTALAGVMLATSAFTMAPAAEARHRHGGGYYYYQPYYSQPYYGDPYAQPYYGNGYYDNGYRYHRRHRHNQAAAAVAGLALGAIIGGEIANSNHGYGGSHVQRCANRYRSYDPRTDTYIGRDGNYYYCRM